MIRAGITTEQEKPGNGNLRTAALLVATVSSFITPFMGSSINVALPSIGKELAMDAVQLSWVATAYLLAAATFLLPFGKIADIYGRKRVFTYGILIYTASSLLSATSTFALALISFRVLQGIGAAMILGTGMAILTSVFPPGERGKALGINTAAVYSGLSLGPFFGGLLTQHFGWRSVFLANVLLGLIVIVIVSRKLRSEWAEAKGQKLDLAGAIIYGLALTALMYGLSLLPALSGGLVILAGILGIAAFVWWEMRAKSPVLDINMFRNNTVFALSNLAALINYSATFAITFLLSLYLQYAKGLSPRDAGLVLVLQPVMMAIVSPFAGRLSDRIEPRVVASIGMALTATGLALLALLGQNTAIAFILGSLTILGIGFGLFSSPNSNAVMSSAEKRFYGVASATLGTMRVTGQMLSMGIAMLVLTIYVGRTQITPEHYPSLVTGMKIAFAIFAALCLGGVFASLARGKMRQRN